MNRQIPLVVDSLYRYFVPEPGPQFWPDYIPGPRPGPRPLVLLPGAAAGIAAGRRVLGETLSKGISPPRRRVTFSAMRKSPKNR